MILQSREYKEWYRTKLTDDERDAIVAVALHLQSEGPALRRPLSGIIKGSKHPNMKESFGRTIGASRPPKQKTGRQKR